MIPFVPESVIFPAERMPPNHRFLMSLKAVTVSGWVVEVSLRVIAPPVAVFFAPTSGTVVIVTPDITGALVHLLTN